MNQQKFTKGPWDLFPNTNGMVSIGHHNQHNNLVMEVAMLPFNDDEYKANAQLIAKAPELLEALQDLLESFESYVDVQSVTNADIVIPVTKARNLIASIQNGGEK